MLALLFVLVVVPIVELYVMVQVAGAIGVLSTVALVVLLSVAGAWLMKAEGLGVLRRMQRQVADGQLPADEVVNGVLILAGGLLMLVPGFVTGAVGLLLLLPPVRALLRPFILARARRSIDEGRTQFAVFTTGYGVGNATFGGQVVDVESHPADDRRRAGDRPSAPPELGS